MPRNRYDAAIAFKRMLEAPEFKGTREWDEVQAAAMKTIRPRSVVPALIDPDTVRITSPPRKKDGEGV